VSESANVTSIEAIQGFQVALAQFCEEAKEALASIDMEGRRILEWVTHDQLNAWRKAVRDRQEDLAQAKAALFQVQLRRLSGDHPACIEQKEAVWLAQARLEEAEDKIGKCQRWGRLLQEALEEYKGKANQLAYLVEGDPSPGVIHLGQILARLEDYVLAAPPSTTSSLPAGVQANKDL
jgi:hypothetical protein